MTTTRQSIRRAVRFAVWERDHYRCVYCGAFPRGWQLQIDHVIPVSKGGRSDVINLVTACWPCNIRKNDKLLPFTKLVRIAPGLRFDHLYVELGRICSTCHGVIDYGGDSFCICSRREEVRCERCGEPLDEECTEELCRPCWARLYLYCWECEENEQAPDDDYCEACQKKMAASQ